MKQEELAKKMQDLSQHYNKVIREQKWHIALEISQQMVQLNPQSAICYNYRGFVYFKLLELDRARLDFEHAIVLDPSNKNAQVMLEKTRTRINSMSDENETIPLVKTEFIKQVANENTETQPIQPLVQNKAPLPTTNDEGFIEEKTTQIIPRTNTEKLLSSVTDILENNDTEKTKIPQKMILVASVMLVAGILVGLLFLPQKKIIHREKSSTTHVQANTIFDTSAKNDFADIAHIEVPSVEENDTQKSLENAENSPTQNPQNVQQQDKTPVNAQENAVVNTEKVDSAEKTPEKNIIAAKKMSVKDSKHETEMTPEEIEKLSAELERLEDIEEQSTQDTVKASNVVKQTPTEKEPPILVDIMGIKIDLRTSKNIVFIVDNSFSMRKNVPEFKKTRTNLIVDALEALLPELNKNKVNINCILYSDKIAVWHPQLIEAPSKGVKDFFTNNTSRKGTNTYGALHKAIKMKNTDTIFIIADGPPGVGKYVTYRDILQHIAKINTSQIPIHVIAIQTVGSTNNFLKTLAKENKGKFYRH